MSRILKEYIKGKTKTILSFFVMIGIFCMISILYDIPVDASVYAIMLSTFFGVAFLTYGFYRYAQRILALEDLKTRISGGIEKLPKAADFIEEEYQEIINILDQRTAEIISKNDQEVTDVMDYFTLWAHQIKTPIAGMRLLLQSDTQNQSKDELLMELFKIEQYVEMVLQYLRLGSDSTDYVIKEQQLDRIIRDAVKKYSTTFVKKKISLNYESVNCTVISDEKWLSFVIEQLLSNSLKYTYSGAISIYMDPQSEKVLVIEDTGIGIQAEDIPRVCEKGYTGYNGRTDKKSTGIGLYLCKEILRKLGHSMEIESTIGKGTKVKLNLSYKIVRFE